VIEHSPSGAVVATGKGVELFRLLALKSALKLEIKGLRMSRRMSALKAAKSITGLSSNKRDVQLAEVERLISCLEPKVTRVSSEPPAPETCQLCGAAAVVPLPPSLLTQQTDGTTHVCHPGMGGCNHGFAQVTQ
jgi:hypothetical protein